MKNVLSKVLVKAGRTGLKLQKISPEICLGIGIASIVIGTVLACKATLKVEEIVDEAKDEIDAIHDIEEADVNDIVADTKKELTKTYVKTAGKLVKEYAPSVICIGAGIASVCKGHSIQKERIASLMAAYAALDAGFKKYRKSVMEQLGDDSDKNFVHDIRKEEVEVVETNKKGEEVLKKKKVNILKSPIECSEYAKYFDSSCAGWERSPEYSMMFLRQMQNTANDLLKARGHLFLNEVYDLLGMERTQAGAVVGWILGNGDNYVEFNIYDVYNERNRAFVNGYEQNILLDFNVDGVIWDKI